MRIRRLVMTLAILATGIGGCAVSPGSSGSSIVEAKLQLVSAGYTGCMPEENAISNVRYSGFTGGTWNAACKGKSYLCSGAYSTDSSWSFHCAPVAQ